MDIARSNLAKSGQISRNAFCPCGSKKRYKRYFNFLNGSYRWTWMAISHCLNSLEQQVKRNAFITYKFNKHSFQMKAIWFCTQMTTNHSWICFADIFCSLLDIRNTWCNITTKKGLRIVYIVSIWPYIIMFSRFF